MNVLKRVVVTMGLLPVLCAAGSISSPQTPLPQGIGVRLTVEGPVFVDAQGMTLYKIDESVSTPAYASSADSCKDDRHALLLYNGNGEGGVQGFTVTVPDVETRRTCLKKHPPLRAPEKAQPIGKWTIHLREDGFRQWAYDGEPLFTSIKDKAPGEVNGSFPQGRWTRYPWTFALAPLAGAPSEVTTRKTAAGLVLASRAGKTLYYSERKELAANPKLWQPLAAPVLAVTTQFPDWSVVTQIDGSRQWAYKGRALYTYLHDSDADTAGSDSGSKGAFGDMFGGPYGPPIDGWHVALLKAAPRHPAEIAVRTIVEPYGYWGASVQRKIYTSTDGMTLYAFHCVEDTADQLDCDDVGDSPRYWLRFCGGEERCANTWRALEAPALAHSMEGDWSVMTINPRHPWRVTDKSEQGLRVWAYKGRPVFTYANDRRPGDYNGAQMDNGVWLRGKLYARVLPAFETFDTRANK